MANFVFYLGTHEPAWLGRVGFPLFVSHRRLLRYRQMPVARCRWALDSGAFSELSMYGQWTVAPTAYVAAVRRYRDGITHLAWAAPQDWLCEPFMVARTGLSVREHQRRTVGNLLELRAPRNRGSSVAWPGWWAATRSPYRLHTTSSP